MGKKNKEKKEYQRSIESYVDLLRKMSEMLCCGNTLSNITSADEDYSHLYNDTKQVGSSLNGFKSVPINSDAFRFRFVDKLIGFFEENIDCVVDNVFKYSRMNTCKYENCEIILNEIAMTIAHFINQFLKPKNFISSFNWSDEYSDSLIDIFKFILIAKGDDAGIELIETFRTERDFLPMAIKNKEDYEDEIVLNDIIKLAFALTTLDPQVDVTPSYDELEGISPEMYPDLISILGQCCKYSKTYNPFYVRFMLCRPEIRTKLDITTDEYIEGLQALEFLKFVMNDKSISKYVDKLISHK